MACDAFGAIGGARQRCRPAGVLAPSRHPSGRVTRTRGPGARRDGLLRLVHPALGHGRIRNDRMMMARMGARVCRPCESGQARERESQNENPADRVAADGPRGAGMASAARRTAGSYESREQRPISLHLEDPLTGNLEVLPPVRVKLHDYPPQDVAFRLIRTFAYVCRVSAAVSARHAAPRHPRQTVQHRLSLRAGQVPLAAAITALGDGAEKCAWIFALEPATNEAR
jgi:hypothetical protein